jgi:serine/threonine protein kinase
MQLVLRNFEAALRRDTFRPAEAYCSLCNRPLNPTQFEKHGINESCFNEGYFDSFFVEKQRLGRGQRGSVFLCQHVLERVILGEFAVKIIPVGESHEWLVRMLKEVRLMQKLKHVNLVEYKHAWVENRKLHRFGPSVPCLFILMELANGGSLEEYIQVQSPLNDISYHFNSNLSAADRIRLSQRRKTKSIDSGRNVNCSSADLPGIDIGIDGVKIRYLTADEIFFMFKDICNGLYHLHSHGIIHRDLKPQNLLLRYSGGSIPNVIISDFGECEDLDEYNNVERTGATGTLEFMPPELLEKDSNGKFKPNHSQSADIWSLGVVLYYLCYSNVPYSQIDNVDLLKEEIFEFDVAKITFPTFGERVPHEFNSLIVRMLNKDALGRPSIQHILSEIELIGQTLTQKGNLPAQAPANDNLGLTLVSCLHVSFSNIGVTGTFLFVYLLSKSTGNVLLDLFCWIRSACLFAFAE